MSVNLHNRSLSQGIKVSLFSWNGEKSSSSIQFLPNQSQSLPANGGTVSLKVFSKSKNDPWFSGPVPTNTYAPVTVDPEREEVYYSGRLLPTGAVQSSRRRFPRLKTCTFVALLILFIVVVYKRRRRRSR